MWRSGLSVTAELNWLSASRARAALNVVPWVVVPVTRASSRASLAPTANHPDAARAKTKIAARMNITPELFRLGTGTDPEPADAR